MKITDALLGEHGVFYAEMDYLDATVPEAQSVAEVHAQAGQLTASLLSHAKMEEELLFRALEPFLGTEAGPLAVMRMEHEEIEGALTRIPGVEDLATAKELLLKTIWIARDHFAKEEHALFVMAQQMLGDARLAKLGEQWADRRGLTFV